MIHLSFDVWNTLLIPNPKFANHRRKSLLPYIGKSEMQYKALKNKYNDPIRNAHAPSPSSFDIWQELCGDVTSASKAKMWSESAFDTYPAFSVEQADRMFDLLNERGITYSILSNTSYVSGFNVSRRLREAYANFQPRFEIYSDIFGYAKPHPKVAKEVIDRVGHMDIVHFGDDYECDVVGVNPIEGIQITTDTLVNAVLNRIGDTCYAIPTRTS